MIVLGINWEQNSTASLWVDDHFVGCLSEERITRKKNDEQYPINAINYLLASNNLTPSQIDHVVFVSNAWSFGYILTRHYTNFSVKDYIREQYEVWRPRLFDNKHVSQLDIFKDKLDLSQFPGTDFWTKVLDRFPESSGHVSGSSSEISHIRKQVVFEHLGISDSNIHFLDHSTCHAAYAYHSIPKKYKSESCLVLTLDAFGDNVNYSASVYSCVDNQCLDISRISSGNDFIIGRLYRYITLILGLKPNEHEYKVMGMAPYCKDQYSQDLFELFKSYQEVEGNHFVYKNRPRDLYFTIRDALEGQRFDSISGAVQRYTEYLITSWVRNLCSSTGIRNVALAGGVGMNVKSNMLLSQLDCIDNVFVPPSPDDSSQAMGATLAFLQASSTINTRLTDFNPYLGCSPNENISQSEFDVTSLFKDYKSIVYSPALAADLLSQGLILARCCGREEFGARALGNRSILADPRNDSVKKRINEKIKNRDFWMPFACSVLADKASEYFLLESDLVSYSYMTLCCMTTHHGEESLKAALHPYDLTCRPQLVTKSMNKHYYDLINSFGERTGVYALLNTSFNLHGLPIVSNLLDAHHVMQNSMLDGIILDSHIFLRQDTSY